MIEQPHCCWVQKNLSDDSERLTLHSLTERRKRDYFLR